MQVCTVTRPPEPDTLVMIATPSSVTSAMGKPKPGQVGNVLVSGIGKIATGDLAGALDQVAHDRPLSKLPPIVRSPAERVHLSREPKRGVGHPSRQDHRGPGRERFHERLGPQIGVGGHEGVAKLTHQPTGLLQPQVSSEDQFEHVVACHRRDGQPVQLMTTSDLDHASAGRERVRPTHVRDDANALVVTDGQHGLHPLDE